MPVDEAVQEKGTETNDQATTGNGAQAEVKESPSFDWEAVKAHPEYKTHVKSTLEADEEFLKEARRGVRLTDVEKRAQERAVEIAAEDRKKADALQAKLDEIERVREAERLSTMTYDEQEMYRLQKRATDAEAKVAAYESEKNLHEAQKAREDIIGYAQTEWGLDDDGAEELRKSADSIDLMDRAFKSVVRQRQKERKELEDLRARAGAKDRVEDGTSAFAATGSASSGGEMSDDEVATLYRNTGTASPNYAKVAAAYAKVYARRGY